MLEHVRSREKEPPGKPVCSICGANMKSRAEHKRKEDLAASSILFSSMAALYGWAVWNFAGGLAIGLTVFVVCVVGAHAWWRLRGE